MVMKNSSLREQMPVTAKIIDQMRESMGVDEANNIIKRAMGGEPGLFFSEENGIRFGTRDTGSTSCYGWNEQRRMVRSDPQWMIEALQYAKSIGAVIERRNFDDPDEAKKI